MNRKYAFIIALAIIANFGLAERSSQDVRKGMYYAKRLSNTELQAAYNQAVQANIAEQYNYTQADHQLRKCELLNWEFKTQHGTTHPCYNFLFDLRETRNVLYHDQSNINNFDDIVYEKHRRKLYLGLTGRGCMSEIIGKEKYDGGQADMYRLEKELHLRSNAELLDKKTRIKEKLVNNEKYHTGREVESNYWLAYQNMAKIKLLAIERELAMQHRKHNNS